MIPILSEFEQHWRQGDQPQIEDFLERVEDASRPSLFRDLIQVEIELRPADESALSLHEDQGRFPAFEMIVREVLALKLQPEPVNIFEQIQAICQEYRQQLKQGQQPLNEDGLDPVMGESEDQ